MRKRSFWRKIADFVFGYDFFVSYAWEDGRDYARPLAEELEHRGFECFIDDKGLSRGDHWRTVVRGAIARTSQLVFVGTPEAFTSEPVIDEIRSFSASGRKIVPIYFSDPVELARDRPEFATLIPAEVLNIRENPESLNSGPTEATLTDLQDSFANLRQSAKRIRVVAGVAMILLMLLFIAITLGFIAEQRRKLADKANREAQLQRDDAQRQKNAAIRLLAESYFARATELINAGQNGPGLAYLSRSLELNPERTAARSLLATSLIYHQWPSLRSFVEDTKHHPVAMSADANIIAVSTGERTLQITTTRGTPLSSEITLPSEASAVLLSPDGKLLLTVHSGTLKLWDAHKGILLGDYSVGTELDSVRFDQRDRIIVTSFSAGQQTDPVAFGVIAFWMKMPDSSTLTIIPDPMQHAGAQTQNFSVPNRISDTAVDPRGSTLLAVAQDGTVTRMALTQQSGGVGGNAKLVPFAALERVVSIDYSHDGRYLLIVNQANECELRNSNGSVLTPQFRKSGIVSAHFSAGDAFVVGKSADGIFQFWRPDGRSESEPIVIGTSAIDADLTPQGNVVAIANDGISEWELPTNIAVDTPLEPAGRLVYAATFEAESSLITAYTARDVANWDASTGNPEPDTPMRQVFDNPIEYHRGANQRERAAALANVLGSTGLEVNGSTVVLTHSENRGTPESPVSHGATVNSAQFSNDHDRLVTASDDETVGIWDAQTGRSLGPRLPHSAPVWSAAFSPDGQRLVSVTADGLVRVWDVPAPYANETVAIQRISAAFGGLQVASDGAIVPVPLSERWRVLESAQNAKLSPATSKLFKWMLTAPDLRGVSPFSGASVADRVRRLKDGVQCHFVFSIQTKPYADIVAQKHLQELFSDPFGVLARSLIPKITQGGPQPLVLDLDHSEEIAKVLDSIGDAKVETQPYCAWTAQTKVSWVMLSPSHPTGRGSGRFKFVTMQNSLKFARTGTMDVADQRITINQAARAEQAGESK